MRDLGCDTGPVPAPPLPGRCDHAAPPSLLRPGCYLIEFAKESAEQPTVLDGTLRVEATTDGVIASGDLYQRPQPEDMVAAPAPDPTAGIPIFPIADYQCYLRVTGVEESAEGVTLTMEEHRVHLPGLDFLDGPRLWFGGSTFSVLLAPDGPLLAGGLKYPGGAPFGPVTARWVSAYLRRATLEIDRVPLSESPESSGTDASWRTIFDEIGWDLTVIPSHNDVTEPTGESWSLTEAHAMMRALRDRGDLDAEWRFHCLAVRRMDIAASPTGWMYDKDATAREGFMVASHWMVPMEPRWGRAQGRRFGTVAPAYFRTAVHELGHAMGLQHQQHGGNSIMTPTPEIAELGLSTPETPFPDNIVMSFAADDQRRLRHWPDLVVRPGTPLTDGQSAPVS